jgi:hypothetical protein
MMTGIGELRLPILDMADIPVLILSGDWADSRDRTDKAAQNIKQELELYTKGVEQLSGSVSRYRSAVDPYIQSPTENTFCELVAAKQRIVKYFNAIQDTVTQLTTLLKAIGDDEATIIEAQAELKTADKMLKELKPHVNVDLEEIDLDYQYKFWHREVSPRNDSGGSTPTPPGSRTPTSSVPEPYPPRPQQRAGHSRTPASSKSSLQVPEIKYGLGRRSS